MKPMCWGMILMISIAINNGCGSGSPSSELYKTTIDLSSDKEWLLNVDDGPWRYIKVPGGGYNSDLQEKPLIDQKDVKGKVTYKRMVPIPETRDNMTYFLAFGAVNHGCEIYLDDSLVGQHVGPLMPFEIDVTAHVEPGNSHELKVVSHPQWYYDYNVPHGFVYDEARKHPDTRPDWVTEAGWATKFSYGISKYVELRLKPAVHLKDIHVQTSVKNNSLMIDLWVYNGTSEKKDLQVMPELSAWNDAEWDYPVIEPGKITIGAGEVEKITLGPVAWDLGPESYWWPNKPFREDYLATLHNLHLVLKEKGRLVDEQVRRFGFVEWAEESNYYNVNGVRINMISDGTPEPAMSEYDCYSTSPAFLPPTDTTAGCPETWKRYMRLGICANRIHQSTPTEYMMDVADELGFILIAETPIRGCQTQSWDDLDPYLKSVRDMARYGRNHPSICRYSLLNEGTTEHIPELIDAILTVDETRPLVFEDNELNRPAVIKGRTGHAYAMLHYREIPETDGIITGMGEYAWHWADRSRYGTVPPGAEGGLEEFIYYGGEMRRRGIVYMAGWDFINYWPNFLEGMTHGKHAWKQSIYPKDREHGIDGWDSPVVTWMQKYFHPYLVLDPGIHVQNGPDTDLSAWPEIVPVYQGGTVIERSLVMFNDGLSGNRFNLRWEARWYSTTGVVADAGAILDIQIEPGFHKEVKYQIATPDIAGRDGRLFLVLTSELDGEIVFKEKSIYFKITRNDN